MLLPQDVIHAYLGSTVAIARYENVEGYVNQDGARVTITHYADGRGNIPRIPTRARACTRPAKMHAYSERSSFDPCLLRGKKALFRAYSAAS